MKKIKTIFGELYCPEEDEKMLRNLVMYGAHQRNDLKMVLDHITTNDTVVDIGAHIGSFSIPISQKAKEVYSFEPTKEGYDFLMKNLALNNVNNVKAYNVALSDMEESLSMKGGLKERGGLGGVSFHPSKDSSSFRSKTLDSYKIEPNFIKIDAEGMEEKILKGGEKTISTCRPILYIEINRKQLLAHNSSMFAIELFLRGHGYKFYRNSLEKNSPNDKYKKTRIFTLYQGGPFFDVLAIPK